jgi:endonuclease/exonuclease/phosphatase family metal-dependent hydrolase
MLNLAKPRELERRAKIIANFDLIALQEVKRPATLNKLRKILQKITGVTWHREVSERVGKGQKGERLAFLYRIDRVKAVHKPHSKGILHPTIPGSFTRPPFYATFRAGSFDFVMISYHAVWGRGKVISREVSLLGGLTQKLAKVLGKEKDILLAGDFNRNGPGHPAFLSLMQAGMHFLIPQKKGTFTTYSDIPEKIGASFYDNIWAPLLHTKEFTGASGVLYPHEQFFQDADYPHLIVRTAISDHCPVWADFRTTQDDD